MLATQLTVDANLFHTQIFLGKVQKTKTAKAVSPILNVQLEADLVIAPQFVKNHRNQSYEIAVQDIDGNLYLIDKQGKILWKKKLERTIQGKIHQVDLYKNGKLQMAFCASNQLLVLDRTGEVTKEIDIKFKGGNVNGLAVFDYENNRNYRLLVTQGKNVIMYDGDGKKVDGFTFSKATSDIIKTPKHFRINKRTIWYFN